MNSTLKLYKNCEILPERFFKVEDIASYLSSLSDTKTYDNFQYLKQELNFVCKINDSQDALEFSQLQNYNYASIKNGVSGETNYYFIIDKKWIAEHTIQLHLSMDTINTFFGRAGFELSDKTRILREHKDRWEVVKRIGEARDRSLVSGELTTDDEEEPPTYFNGSKITQPINEWTFGNKQSLIMNLDQNTFFLKYGLFVADLKYFRVNWYTAEGKRIYYQLATIDKTNFKLKRILNTFDRQPPQGDQGIGEYRFQYDMITHNPVVIIDMGEENEKKFVLDGDEYVCIVNLGEETINSCHIVFEYDQEEVAEWPINDVIKTGFESVFYAISEDFVYVSTECTPKIDLYSEGFTPTLYGNDIEYLKETGDLDWYLVYINQNDPSESLDNPVFAYLMPSENVIICSTNEVSSRTFTVHDFRAFPVVSNMFFVGAWQPNFQLVLPACLGGGTMTITRDQYIYVDVGYNMAQSISIDVYKYKNDGTLLEHRQAINIFPDEPEWNEEITIKNCLVCQAKEGVIPSEDRPVPFDKIIQMKPATAIIQTDFQILNNFRNVNRTDPKLVKIIQAPYCPCPVVVNNNTNIEGYVVIKAFDVDSWEQEWFGAVLGNVLKLRSLNKSMKKTISFHTSSLSNWPFLVLENKDIYFQWDGRAKSMEFETKLYHSDFYQPKIIYDSFSFAFNFEMLNMDEISEYSSQLSQGYLTVEYTLTNTVNSRFLFQYVDYRTSGKDLQDYNNVMVVSRNNEMAIYNQQFINYLRAGYNYDVKSKTRTEVMAYGMATLQLIGSIASFVGAAYTGGSTAALGVGLAVGAASTYASAAATSIQAEQNIEAKMAQLKNQATSVYGADDVDLMDQYAKNKLKVKLYKCSPKVQKAMWDLFYYTGYIGNYMGIPNTTSRTRFNFVQAEIVFKKTPNLSKELREDLVAKFKAGITFLHHYKSTWDFNQEKENWERSIMLEE